MKIQELLSDESKWTKGEMARNIDGDQVGYDNPTAVCWCLLGAINKCYPYEKRETIRQKIFNFINDSLLCEKGITGFNDSPKITFSDVKNLITELDI